MSKKSKTNRYKPEVKKGKGTTSDFDTSSALFLKCIMSVTFISILSLASIFIYDFMTQSKFFNIKEIEISGTNRVQRQDLLKLADLTGEKNILEINLSSIKKHIISHPWIQSASIKRNLPSGLFISIMEQDPLAIVKIENLADILINTQGTPFKEYDPLRDGLKSLPIITGIDLTRDNDQHLFNGTLFNAVMNFLQTYESSHTGYIIGNKNTGITVESRDIYNQKPVDEQGTIQIKLGFDNFKAKLNKAKNISRYIAQNFPEKTICAMDFFNIEKVFIKTKFKDTLHNNLEKGVCFAGN
ncbi:cell division protein FtsQ/DivIB [Desulfobacula sp.]